MFCKWCGANIPNNSPQCVRCGREVPAKSDCGGFYDLVPNARTASAAVQPPPISNPIPAEPQRYEPPRQSAPAAPRKANKRKNTTFRLITIVGFIVILLWLLLLTVRMYTGFSLLDDLNERVVSIIDESQETIPDDSEEAIPGESEEAIPGESEETIPDESEATEPFESGLTTPSEPDSGSPSEAGDASLSA